MKPLQTTIRLLLLSVFSVAFLLSAHSISAQAQEFPERYKNCYADPSFGFKKTPDQKAHLYVLIDQTVGFDIELQKNVYQAVINFLQPGLTISIFNFSSNVNKQSIKRASRLWLDTKLTSLQGFFADGDQDLLAACQDKQKAIVQRIIGVNLSKIFNDKTPTRTHSEVLYNLKIISDAFRRDRIKRKYILLVSDMIENSHIASFYDKEILKRVNIKEELKAIKAKGYVNNFRGARVFIAGGGYGQESPFIGNLEAFWRAYFNANKGKLIEFGKPQILNPIN